MSVLRDKALHRTGRAYPIITIQEAGLDGFWLHRLLTREGIESNVVDPASITVSRRRRQAKTDRLDGETLLRALMAHKRGDPRLRVTLVQSAWLWLRHQPNSALSKWFRERTQANHGRRKKSTIVALARKLLVALWKYVTSGVLIEGVITNKV
ncbi:MAG: transposase [Mesorhizobium sp.]|nr:MAG: transposase [Mesorhizobium sp.]RWP80397.1 MAG: transposase [Mesorhizobium sp.]